MSTFLQLEAKAALEAAEAVLGDMVTSDSAAVFQKIGEAVATELSSGKYPKLMLYVATHQMNYPRVTEVVGVLFAAAMRARATAGATAGTLQ